MATESIQPYTTARVNYLASYLQTLLPGLDTTVATKWITAEKGVSGNVLGTTYSDASGQHLFTYPSQEAGLRAAASWITTKSRYSGVKSSLGSSASAQATALATSGWNNSYYPGVFASVISHTGSSAPGGGTSTPLTVMPSIPSGNLGAFGNLISFPTGHILTAADTKALGDAAKQMNSNLGISDPLGAGEAKTRAGLDLWINSPWTKATQDQIAASFGSAATQTPGTNLPAIPDVQTAITFVGIILVGVAFLGLGGLIALRKKSE